MQTCAFSPLWKVVHASMCMYSSMEGCACKTVLLFLYGRWCLVLEIWGLTCALAEPHGTVSGRIPDLICYPGVRCSSEMVHLADEHFK